MKQQIIKEKFTLNETLFVTKRVVTPLDVTNSIGNSLYNQSKLKMDNNRVVEK